MDDAQRKRMMQEILEGMILPTQVDGEFTAEELAQEGNVQASTMHRALLNEIEQGRMTRRMVRTRDSGRRAWAYRKVQDDDRAKPDQK
jgi:predicted transcriptional regulator